MVNPAISARRRDLETLLTQGCRTEHELMCGCISAAYGIMADAEAAGYDGARLDRIRGWRDKLLAEAARRMDRVVQVGVLMTTIGAVPGLRRPEGAGFGTLSASALERMNELARGVQADDIVSMLRLLPEDSAILCSDEGKAAAEAYGEPLIAVCDRPSTLEALTKITEPSDIFSAMAIELAMAEAEDGVPAPRRCEGFDADKVAVIEDLAGSCYDTLLAFLLRFLTTSEESATDVRMLLDVTRRLMASVIRPLTAALARMRDTPPRFGSGDAATVPSRMASAWAVLDERLWDLACTATRLRVEPGMPLELLEATAALQDLGCWFGPDAEIGVRVGELRRLQASLPAEIIVVTDGPYLVTNPDEVTDWLGRALPAQVPQLALCRCGESARKPLCDGSHTMVGFSGAKDRGRVPDRLDTYTRTAPDGDEGRPFTFTDNRGLCAHSGFCTDTLPAAFRVDQEPFADPDAESAGDLRRAIRQCPSGALGLADHGADAAGPGRILVSRDGPYRVSGSISLREADGGDVPRNEGASLEHYSLCRCGHSQNKPFCSGMHWYAGFRDPVYDDDHSWTLFEWAGGLPALTRVTRLFYEKYVPADPIVGPLFAHMAPDHPERVASWLAETFGGPGVYTDRYGGYPRMLSQHIGKGLSEDKRARWVELLIRSVNHAGLPADPEFRSAFASYIEWGSRIALENSQPGARPPFGLPVPHWDWGTAGPPGSRVSALAPSEEPEEAVEVPEGETVSFAEHVKPLFRSRDRQSMKWAFDLWSIDDVRTHAEGILARLRDGSMPCDTAWPEEKIRIFQRWRESGMPD